MGKPTRIARGVFVVAALASCGTLSVLWFAWQPLLPLVTWLASQSWFNVALLVLLGIVAVGLAVMLVSAFATPSAHAKLVITHDGGSVGITKDAIRSTVTHAIEEHRGLACKSVQVVIKGRRIPRIFVSAKVDPGALVNLTALGAALQREVSERVSAFAGYPVQEANITFTSSSDAAASAAATRASAGTDAGADASAGAGASAGTSASASTGVNPGAKRAIVAQHA